MQVANARATFVPSDAIDESLTTLVARSVLEAALTDEKPAELWFEFASDDSADVARLSVELSDSDIEGLLRLAPEDEIALSLDGETIESLFGDPDVEAHGLKGAIAIAVTSAALLAPAGHAALPQSVGAAATTQGSQVQVTAQVRPAATAQVAGVQSTVQVSKAQVAKLKGFKLLRSGLAR